MKWFIVLSLFYYSCYEPYELEIIYEDKNVDYLVFTYDLACGIAITYPDGVSEDVEEYKDEYERDEPPSDVFIPWKLW